MVANISDILGAAIILIVFVWIILGIYAGVKKQSIASVIEEIKEWATSKPEEIKENVKSIKILP